MYSQLCPWLLTWSDLEEDFNNKDGDGTTTPMQTRNVSQSVACRVVGMTWVINAALVSAA
jgi:hypothetical protein